MEHLGVFGEPLISKLVKL